MRIRPFLPLLLSTVALPVHAGDYNACLDMSDALGCVIERAEFARQRNAEINDSLTRVERVRAQELAMSLTHCKSVLSQAPRCIAERERHFAEIQNALANASANRVADARAIEAARRAEIAAASARVAAERARELQIEQNRLIEASLTAFDAERARRFVAHQNALASASMERVGTERRRQLALQLSPCKSETDVRPRCEAHRAREFAAQQNVLARMSMARVEAERIRAFAAARNAESAASMAAVERSRAAAGNQMQTASIQSRANGVTQNALGAAEYAALTSHCVRVPGSPRCEAERLREFAAARNAEVERSLAAVAATRAAARQQDHAAAGHPASYCTAHAESATCVAADQTAQSECRTVGYSSSDCDFRSARNAEIERSLAAVAAARANGQLNHAAAATGHATYTHDLVPLETGAIGMPSLPKAPSMLDESDVRHDISTDACRASAVQPQPVRFSNGAAFDNTVRSELEGLALQAENCPGMRIEVHGYADGGSPFGNRSLSQTRAQAVADYLIAAGVAPNRVSAIGRGGKEAALPYSKDYDPAFGGRAEFIVRDPGTDAAARRVMWDLAELLDPTYIPAVANLSP